MSRSAVARTVPSSTGTSYVLPVRLSVIVSESDAVAVPPPFVLCSSVPIALLCEGGSNSRSLHCGGADPPHASRRDDGRHHRARDEQRADAHDGARGPGGRRERLVPEGPEDPQAEPERDEQPGEDVERGLRRLIGGHRQQVRSEHRPEATACTGSRWPPPGPDSATSARATRTAARPPGRAP